MLTFTLKKEWYDKIRSGEKTVEYREVKPYWTKRLEKEFEYLGLPNTIGLFFKYSVVGSYFRVSAGHRCTLRFGYTKQQMTADITKIEVVDGKDTDLRVDKPVYAIYLANVREIIYGNQG